MSLAHVSTSELFSDAVADGGVTVDLDASLFVQLALFLILLVVLKPLLFDPMMKLFEEREKRIEGARAEATAEDQRSSQALTEYEKTMTAAREAGALERDALRAAGVKEEASIMAEVRQKTAATLEQGRAMTASDVERMRRELVGEGGALAGALASRVLGREIAL